MPDKILIDTVNYQVILTKEVIVVEGQECGAEIDYNASTITFSDNAEKVGEGAKAKILMHEVVHGILHERGLYNASEDEELVEELAKGFVNLIRDNPRLIDFVKGAEESY